MNARWILALTLLVSPTPACDKGDKGDKGDKKRADDKQAEAKPKPKVEAPPPPKEKKLELPWRRDQVSESLEAGLTLIYKQTGKDADGKKVEDDYQCQIKRATATEVGTVCNGINHPSKDKGANEIATAEWTGFSPFFAVSKPETKLVERADLTVPAGTFDTVQVEIAGFFGNSYTVWMIADKPGIYAKVHKHANSNTEADKTDMVFELAKLPE